MASPTIITLPRERPVIFPDRCVGCGNQYVAETMKFEGRQSGWFFSGPTIAVHAPVCALCRPRIENRRAYQAVLIVGLLGLGGLAWYLYVWPIDDWLARKFITWGLILLAISPLIIWEWLAPPPFCISVYSTVVEFRFASQMYAREFEACNPL